MITIIKTPFPCIVMYAIKTSFPWLMTVINGH